MHSNDYFRGEIITKAEKVLKSNVVFDSIADRPFPGGIAITGNKIIAVAKEKDIDKYIGGDTQVFEYKDKLIMPSFIDAYQHYVIGAINNSEHLFTDIMFSKSEEDCVRILKEYAESHPKETTIRGSGWLPAIWRDAPLPDKNLWMKRSRISQYIYYPSIVTLCG